MAITKARSVGTDDLSPEERKERNRVRVTRYLRKSPLGVVSTKKDGERELRGSRGIDIGRGIAYHPVASEG